MSWLASLRKEVKKADKIYLATGPDREGEAISWHLCHALRLDPKKQAGLPLMKLQKCGSPVVKAVAGN